jgi:uroporphyrinogen III methyltransferase/synthase
MPVRRPCVYLVGAGPGDPTLISLRGWRCLRTAEVVVYDHLVHPRLLREAPAAAERIDVGAAAPKPLEQDAICLLLAEKAREGKIVVRLKWGDPFVFDSGGREALFLHEQGIAFEVVPGIPAAVGAPAYAGVPVTYPEAGDALVLIRGHEAETPHRPRVDWGRLAPLDATLVCYASGAQLPDIIQALLAHGRSPQEPAVLIYRGTLPGQHTVESTLGALARQWQQAVDYRPAILVVGRVAALRAHLRWFDERPLFGKRIVVTRAREQAAELVELLVELGADPIEVPTIRIVPPADPGPLEAAIDAIETFQWVVFTSVNGVEQFMTRLLARRDVRDLKGVRLCAIGPATAERLGRYGIRVDLIPAEYRAEAVVDSMRASGPLGGTRILLARAERARELLADELRKSGAQVVEVAAYRTIEEPERDEELDIYKLLLEKQIDVVTFTSASTVRSFVRLLGTETAADLLNTTVVAAIGPVTAEAAAQLGIRTAIVPPVYTVPALVEAIVEYFRTRQPVRVRGS